MLETRLPLSSLPSPLPRPVVRPAPRREPAAAPARAVPRPLHPRPSVTPSAVPRRAGHRSLGHSRLARSEARMLTLAVAVAALMCAVLVVYLAAYAHVTQLGLEQAAAHRQLAQEISDSHQLQVEQAELQDRGRIVAEAGKLRMAFYTGPATYVTASGADGSTSDTGGADGGTTADDDVATGGH